MKIGVIGSTGFLGTNLIKYLGTSFPKEDVIGTSKSLGIDATKYDDIYRFIYDNRITHLINLAAFCGGIGLNKTNPFDLWYESTLIGANVLKASVELDIEKLIMIGTVCSYSSDTPVPFKEEYLMKYGEPEETNRAYGVSKLNSLYGARSAKKQFGINTVNLIPVNMYGPHDNFDLNTSHVIPAIIRKIFNAKKTGEIPEFWGDGSATREFLYVVDCCDAIYNALIKIDDDNFYNVGSGTEIKIKDLVILISNKLNYKGEIYFNSNMPNGQMRRSLDTSKLSELIDWRSTTSLSHGLDATINWFITNKVE